MYIGNQVESVGKLVCAQQSQIETQLFRMIFYTPKKKMEKIKNICGEDEEGGEGQYLDSALGSTNYFSPQKLFVWLLQQKRCQWTFLAKKNLLLFRRYIVEKPLVSVNMQKI